VRGRGYQGGVSFGPTVTPPIVKQLLIANAAVFFAQILSQGWLGYDLLSALGAVVPREFFAGQIWQAFTYMFLHGGLGHIAVNMLTLWMFGAPLALAWGARRFLRFYLLCGVGAGLLIATLPYVLGAVGLHFPSLSPSIPTLGASGAVYGVLLAYSLTWPEHTIMLLFPPIPIRAIYLIPFVFALNYILGPSNVSHVGHFGGVLAAWILIRREHGASLLPNVASLRWRLKRWRMRRQLRAVRVEEDQWRRRAREHDDHRIH